MGKTVGLFGLGLIGQALAARLLAAGHRVQGYDPDAERLRLLEEMGGVPSSGADLWSSDVVLSAVFSTDQLARIVDEAPMTGGAVLVSMSTCDPDEIAGLADAAEKKSITLVESPISGTSKQVREGTALLLLAGDPRGLDCFEEVADAISTHRARVGAIGNGNRTKLAINCILGLKRAALAEGLVFAEAMGLDPAVFLDIALGSAARSDVMASKGPAMVARDFAPLGRIVQSRKDFRLIAEMGARHGLPALPMVSRYLDLMDDAVDHEEGDLDNSAVLLAIARRARG